MAYNQFSGLLNLSVSGKGFADSVENSVTSTPAKDDDGSYWSRLFPTIYTAPGKRQHRAVSLKERKKSLEYYLPWITQILGQHDQSGSIHPLPISDIRTMYPNLFGDRYRNILARDQVIALVGLAMNLPSTPPNTKEDPTNVVKVEGNCDMCLCDILSRGSKFCGNIHHDHGRHQRCVCECYCHLQPSEMSLVHLAAKSGHVKILEQLLKSGEEPDQTDVFENTPLHLASLHGYVGTTALLLQKQVNPNKQNVNGNTALHIAARYGHTGSVVILLRHGAGVNIANNELQTALHWAVKENHHNVVQHLLRHANLKVNQADQAGETALHYAVRYADCKIMEMLIKHPKRVDINAQNHIGETPIHLATQLGRIDLITILMRQPRIDPDAIDQHGNTALHMAVKYCNEAALQELIAAKKGFGSREICLRQLPLIGNERLSTARSTYYPEKYDSSRELAIDILTQLRSKLNVNAKNSEGQTALHLAVTSNAGLTIVKELVENGASLAAGDSSGNNALHLAVSRGNFVMMRALLSSNVDINASNSHGQTALHLAVNFEDLQMAMGLLQAGADPNCSDRNARTPLHSSAERSLKSLATLLLDKGACIQRRDVDGRTAVHTAITRGDERLALMLLKDYKADDVPITDRRGDTVLHLACKHGLGRVVRKLLTQNPDTLHTQNVYGNSPLHYACKYGHQEVVRSILEYSEENGNIDTLLNMENIAGKTTLHMAVKGGHTLATQYLVNKGAVVNYGDRHGRSPLHLLAACDDEAASMLIADILFKAGAKVDSEDANGETPLHVASKFGRNAFITRLIADGASINKENSSEHTPLHLASAYGHDESIELLVNSGADFEKVKSNGNSAIHGTAASGSRVGMSLLIEHGVSPDTKNQDGMTPLHVAAHNDQDIIIDYLVDVGANLNCTDSKGRLALHIASASGNSRAVRSLLKHGLEVNTPDSDGRTSLHYACIEGHVEVIDILKEGGGDMNQPDFQGTTPTALLCEPAAAARKVGNVTGSQANSAELLLVKPLEQLSHRSDDFRLVPYLNFVRKLKYMSHENLEVPSHHQSMSALDCPRYLNHMKAHDQADKVMAELEYRAVQSKLNRENRLKEQKETKKEVRVVSPLEYDELRSHCTEDDIAEQFGLLTQPNTVADPSDPVDTQQQSIKPELPTLIPLSPENLVTGIEYRLSLPEIFNMKRNSVIPTSHENHISFEHLVGQDDDQGDDLICDRAPTVTSVHSELSESEVGTGRVSTRQVLTLSPSPMPPPTPSPTPPVAEEPKPKPKSEFPSFYVPKARAFAKTQPTKTTAEPKKEKGIDIALSFIQGLLGGKTSPSKTEEQKALLAAMSPGVTDDESDTDDTASQVSTEHSHEQEHPCDPDQSLGAHGFKLKGSTLNLELEDELTVPKVRKPRPRKTRRENPGRGEKNSLAHGDGLWVYPSIPAVTIQVDGDGDDTENRSVSGHFATDAHLSVHSASSSNRLTEVSRLATPASLIGAVTTEYNMGNKSPTNQSLRPSYYSSPIVIPTSPMPVEGETTPLRDTALVESTGDSRSITMQRLPTLLSSESSEFSPKPPTAPKSPAMHRRQNVAGELSSPEKLPEISPSSSPSSLVHQKRKGPNIRRPGQLLATSVSTPTPPLTANRQKKEWIFDDEEGGRSLSPDSERSGSEMSFDIHPRTPTPEVVEEQARESVQEVSEEQKSELTPAQQEKKKWGKARIDNKFREELERQRLAEERKKKAMRMRIARAQLKNTQLSEHELDPKNNGHLSDSDWLSQYCIFGRGSLEIYRGVFEALLGSTGESTAGPDMLTMSEVLMALNNVNRELQSVEQHYIIRICELLGYDVSKGCDYKHFTLIAALSHRITSLDKFMRRMYRNMDTKVIDISITFCQRLWSSTHDPDSNNLMSKDRLMLELKAGGISPQHEEYVKQALMEQNRGLDFLDFLSYIPLFLLIHRSVVTNPFDDSRVK